MFMIMSPAPTHPSTHAVMHHVVHPLQNNPKPKHKKRQELTDRTRVSTGTRDNPHKAGKAPSQFRGSRRSWEVRT